jgi:Na+/proline symporter
VGTGIVHAVRTRLARSSLTLVASLAAASMFGIAVLVGWATAGTREDLRRAPQLPAGQALPRLVQLGSVPKLPAAPRERAARNPSRPEVPRLIVGSG